MFRRGRRLAILVVVNLALGLGATAAVFSVVNALLLQPLPYPEAQQLITLHNGMFPKGAYAALRRHMPDMAWAAYETNAPLTLLRHGQPVSLQGSAISANLLQVLQVTPAIGGGFAADANQPDQDGGVLLSDGAWRRQFGASRSIVGQEIGLGGRQRRVLGVMPAGFRFPNAATQFWIPFPLDAVNVQDYWEVYSVQFLGRLAPGMTLARARTQMHAATAQAAAAFPYPVPADWASQYSLIPLQESLFGNLRTALLLVLAAAGLVLLIACANAANLLLTQFAGEEHDTAVRLALGAGRWRILKRFLLRALGMALAGGAGGLLLAAWALPALLQLLPATATARPAVIGLDWRAVGFAFSASLLGGLLAGLLPAWRHSRACLPAGLRQAAPAATRFSLGTVLLVAETALVVVVVVAAAMLAGSLSNLRHIDPGFQAAGVQTLRINPPPDYCTAGRCAQLYRRIQARAAALPGVQAAALVNAVPLGGLAPIAAVAFSGHPLVPGTPVPLVWANLVTPGYIRTLEIPLLAGRVLASGDGPQAQRVALINASLARQLWPGQSPLGKQVATLINGLVPWTIVGVVADVREMQLQGDPGFYRGEVYFPYAQALVNPPIAPSPVMGSLAGMTLVLHSGTPPAAGSLHALLETMDKTIPPAPVRPLAGIVAASIAAPRATTWLFSLFAALALIMAMFGVYALSGEFVAQRRRDIGLRLALGAQSADVLRLVLLRGLALAACGVLVGLIAAWGAARLLASLLFQVSPGDPVWFAVAAAVVLVVAAAAAYGPARRATRVDPMLVLRGD